MALHGRWVASRLQFYDGDYSAIGNGGVDFGNVTGAALLHGGGTSTYPLVNSTADKNFMGYWVQSSATSGTSRGQYVRLYLSGGAGGEAIRGYTTVSNDTPVDTVNGAHLSLSFGASAGNVTGEGQAMRATLHIPNRTLGGTTAAIKAELYADGTTSSSAALSNGAFIRCVAAGDATGVAAAVDTTGYFISIDGLTANSGKMFRVAAPTTLAASLRCRVGATTYYLPLYSAAA